jgi:L-ribulose-5-phosphate 4-epimerase
MSDYRDLKLAIIDACLRLQNMGYLVGTYGNASARVPGGLIVTPSRVDYAAITPDDMVIVSDDGRILEGYRPPSSETSVHRLIMNARPDIGAIFHTHSLYASALSCLHETIPVIVEEQSQVIGAEIRCSQYVPAGQHHALGVESARALGASNGVLLANHGVVACGRTIDEAVFTAQIVERIAQMYLLTRAVGAPVPIPQEYVDSERERWLYKYGTAADRAIDA